MTSIFFRGGFWGEKVDFFNKNHDLQLPNLQKIHWYSEDFFDFLDFLHELWEMKEMDMGIFVSLHVLSVHTTIIERGESSTTGGHISSHGNKLIPWLLNCWFFLPCFTGFEQKKFLEILMYFGCKLKKKIQLGIGTWKKKLRFLG